MTFTYEFLNKFFELNKVNMIMQPSKQFTLKEFYDGDTEHHNFLEYVNNNYKAAGILPYYYNEQGTVKYLFINEHRKDEKQNVVNIAGGKRESYDISPLNTALREFDEETNSAINKKVMLELCESQELYLTPTWIPKSKYVLYLLDISEIISPKIKKYQLIKPKFSRFFDGNVEKILKDFSKFNKNVINIIEPGKLQKAEQIN